jgi:hypothetical protein
LLRRAILLPVRKSAVCIIAMSVEPHEIARCLFRPDWFQIHFEQGQELSVALSHQSCSWHGSPSKQRDRAHRMTPDGAVSSAPALAAAVSSYREMSRSSAPSRRTRRVQRNSRADGF